jgi:CRISPR/Cas system CMR-associated protein Cmr3 (group 5 of RAMP superfamily)
MLTALITYYTSSSPPISRTEARTMGWVATPTRTSIQVKRAGTMMLALKLFGGLVFENDTRCKLALQSLVHLLNKTNLVKLCKLDELLWPSLDSSAIAQDRTSLKTLLD